MLTVEHSDQLIEDDRTAVHHDRLAEHALKISERSRTALEGRVVTNDEAVVIGAHQEGFLQAAEAFRERLDGLVNHTRTPRLFERIQVRERHFSDRTNALCTIASRIGREPLHVRHAGQVVGIETLFKRITLCYYFGHLLGRAAITQEGEGDDASDAQHQKRKGPNDRAERVEGKTALVEHRGARGHRCSRDAM